MPLTAVELLSTVKFAFERTVGNWEPITQGENQVAFSLNGIDVAVWDDAFATVFSLIGGGDTTFDLSSFSNLAGEGVTFTAVLAIIVTVTPTDPDETDIAISIGPGDSDGLEWLAGANPMGPFLAGESFVRSGDPAGDGFAVDGTHKTLKVTNDGADHATVRIVIVGSTL